MKKISVIILLIVVSLYASAQSPGSGGNDPATAANGDTTEAGTTPEFGFDTGSLLNQLTISKDSVEALKNSKDLVYLKNLDSLLRVAQKEQMQQEQPSRDSNWIGKFFGSVITRDVFWTLAACFVLFILYKLFLTEGIFQKRSAFLKVSKEEEEEATLHTVSDYNLLIEKAITTKDFRSAVRFLYLLALRQLSDDKLIELAPDKTNYQYQLELTDKEIKNLFALITFQYECVWYGGFEIDETAFNSIRNDFKKFTGQL
jgi:hypothetical protein